MIVRNKFLARSSALHLCKQNQKLNFKLMSIYELHYIGGMPFMIPLSIILIAIVGLIIVTAIRGEGVNSKWIVAIKQLGGFALAWGAFSTLVGFYQAFSDLSQMKEMLPLNIIMGGLKVALITTLYGFGVFLFAQIALIALKLRKTDR
jgi:hypothetical protein